MSTKINDDSMSWRSTAARSAYRSCPRRPCPSVRRTAPEPGTHGRIADGGGPQSRL